MTIDPRMSTAFMGAYGNDMGYYVNQRVPVSWSNDGNQAVCSNDILAPTAPQYLWNGQMRGVVTTPAQNTTITMQPFSFQTEKKTHKPSQPQNHQRGRDIARWIEQSGEKESPAPRSRSLSSLTSPRSDSFQEVNSLALVTTANRAGSTPTSVPDMDGDYVREVDREITTGCSRIRHACKAVLKSESLEILTRALKEPTTPWSRNSSLLSTLNRLVVKHSQGVGLISTNLHTTQPEVIANLLHDLYPVFDQSNNGTTFAQLQAIFSELRHQVDKLDADYAFAGRNSPLGTHTQALNSLLSIHKPLLSRLSSELEDTYQSIRDLVKYLGEAEATFDCTLFFHQLTRCCEALEEEQAKFYPTRPAQRLCMSSHGRTSLGSSRSTNSLCREVTESFTPAVYNSHQPPSVTGPTKYISSTERTSSESGGCGDFCVNNRSASPYNQLDEEFDDVDSVLSSPPAVAMCKRVEGIGAVPASTSSTPRTSSRRTTPNTPDEAISEGTFQHQLSEILMGSPNKLIKPKAVPAPHPPPPPKQEEKRTNDNASPELVINGHQALLASIRDTDPMSILTPLNPDDVSPKQRKEVPAQADLLSPAEFAAQAAQRFKNKRPSHNRKRGDEQTTKNSAQQGGSSQTTLTDEGYLEGTTLDVIHITDTMSIQSSEASVLEEPQRGDKVPTRVSNRISTPTTSTPSRATPRPNRVAPPPPPPPPPPPRNNTSQQQSPRERGALLASINALRDNPMKSLKKSEHQKDTDATQKKTPPREGGLLSDLTAKLAKRRQGIEGVGPPKGPASADSDDDW